MQDRIDCALLCSPFAQGQPSPWLGRHAKGQLHVRQVDMPSPTPLTDTTGVPLIWPAALPDFDLCLLWVGPSDLSWARTLLGQSAGRHPVPVVVLAHQLQAVALQDLLLLGASDFMVAPGAIHELLARVQRAVRLLRRSQLDALSHALGEPAPAGSVPPAPPFRCPARRSCRSVMAAGQGVAVAASLPMAGRPREQPVNVYAMGRLVAYSRNGQAEQVRHHSDAQHSLNLVDAALRQSLLMRNGTELEAFAAATAARCAIRDEPFQQAKGRVVAGFEKAYLAASLDRHAGNIAQAARAACKHRRAYWQLLRKHDIDIAPYREQTQTTG